MTKRSTIKYASGAECFIDPRDCNPCGIPPLTEEERQAIAGVALGPWNRSSKLMPCPWCEHCSAALSTADPYASSYPPRHYPFWTFDPSNRIAFDCLRCLREWWADGPDGAAENAGHIVGARILLHGCFPHTRWFTKQAIRDLNGKCSRRRKDFPMTRAARVQLDHNTEVAMQEYERIDEPQPRS